MNFKKKWFIISIIIFIISILIFIIHNVNKYSNGKFNIDISSESINWDNYENKDIILESDLSITSEGIYTLSGNLEGMVTINTTGNVKLILNEVTITSSKGPAIYVKNAKNVVIFTSEGTINTLSDAKTYKDIDDKDVEGAIFSKSDLYLEGEGTLILNGNKADALVSKDNLIINGGKYIITSVDDGIRGKDSVYIKNGDFTIKSTCDAIKSTNNKNKRKGFVKIEGGTFNITTTNRLVDKSTKGIKAVNVILIEDGTFNIDSWDDAIHSDNIVKIINGKFEIKTEDDGIHADNYLTIDDGTINIIDSYEGIESGNIVINDGIINVTSKDDAINGSGKNSSKSRIYIYGGNISVVAGDDGLDSNGDLYIYGGYIKSSALGDGIEGKNNIYIYGGEIYIDGPDNGIDGAVDFAKKMVIDGGTIVGITNYSMPKTLDNTSKQYGILVNFSKDYSKDDTITLEDNSGNKLLSYTASNAFSSILYSSNLLKKNETYIVKVNGIDEQTVTISSIVTSVGNLKYLRNLIGK